MKNSILGRPVNGREDSDKALALLFAAKKRNQIDSLAFDRLVDLLSPFVSPELLDCRFDDWHRRHFTIK